ncbi:hypothetical protein KJA13_02235 [Patescibacteria group bacterium]|nr:hypothetical protein [Patescibacteria group bacterium]
MNPYQEKIKIFCEERNWNQFHNPKDILLGIVEEVGEFRNIVKWEQNPEVVKKLLFEKREEVKDVVGDIFWFLSLLANSCDVDIDKAIQMTIEDNKKRFPIEETKDKHTNIYLGGHDGKY